jgi:hypothetical protein
LTHFQAEGSAIGIMDLPQTLNEHLRNPKTGENAG